MLLFLRLDATYQPKHPAAWERTGPNRLKAAKLPEPQSFILLNLFTSTQVCQEKFSRLMTRNLTGAQQKLSNGVISCRIWLFTHLRTTEIRNRLFAVLQVFAPENAVFSPFQAQKRRYSAVLFLRTPSFHSMLSAPHRHRLPKPARHDRELFRNRVHVVENRNRPKTAFLGFTCFPAEKRAFSPFASPKTQISGSTLFARRSIECARMTACACTGRPARSCPSNPRLRREAAVLSASAHVTNRIVHVFKNEVIRNSKNRVFAHFQP